MPDPRQQPEGATRPQVLLSRVPAGDWFQPASSGFLARRTKLLNPIRRSSAGVQGHMNRNDRGTLCQKRTIASIVIFSERFSMKAKNFVLLDKYEISFAVETNFVRGLICVDLAGPSSSEFPFVPLRALTVILLVRRLRRCVRLLPKSAQYSAPSGPLTRPKELLRGAVSVDSPSRFRASHSVFFLGIHGGSSCRSH
jgi:hypothetical protein